MQTEIRRPHSIGIYIEVYILLHMVTGMAYPNSFIVEYEIDHRAMSQTVMISLLLSS